MKPVAKIGMVCTATQFDMSLVDITNPKLLSCGQPRLSDWNLRSLISAVDRCLESKIPLVSIPEISSL